MLLSIQKASIENKSRLRIIAFILIGISILYGTHLRYVAITQTEVYIPIRADAFDYFNYASNLATWGIYSKQAVDKNSLEPPVPDSLRSVGFPAFASLFITDNVNASVDSAIFAQTFLQILCLILLTIVIVNLLGIGWAIPTVFLLWSFPHLVSVNVYYLSESLFSSALAVLVFLLWYFSKESNISLKGISICGFFLGITALIRPSMEYFPLFVVFFTALFSREALKKALLFTLFALIPIVIWKLRNVAVIGSWSDPYLMINSLYHGSFPNFMYNNDPSTFGFPYRFDPDAQKFQAGIGAALGLIWERFLVSPLQYLYWYVIGKQTYLWQWNIVAGQGDIFIYPIIMSPYTYLVDMKATHAIHHIVHNVWVVIGLFATLTILFLTSIKKIKLNLVWIFIALFIFYAMLLHAVVAPFPRYSIPYKILLLPLSFYCIKESLLWIDRVWKNRKASQ